MDVVSRRITAYASRQIYPTATAVLARYEAGQGLVSKLATRASALYTDSPPWKHVRGPLPAGRRAYHGVGRKFSTSTIKSSSAKFTYGIAASYTAKGRKFDASKNVYDFDPENPIYRHRKDRRTRPDSGQDAYFVSRVGDTNDFAFGVADGVGGWSDSGVDSAHFAHGICDHMAYTAYTQQDGEHLRPQALLQQGYDDLVNEKRVLAGGSTACVAISRQNGELEIANLGDSGFVQLRLNAVHNYSEPQTHAFNTPFQLAMIPDLMRARTALFGGQQLSDMPKDANVTKHNLRHGDVLILATDGVWDNLSSSDALRVVSLVMTDAGAWEHTNDGIKVSDNLSALVKRGKPDSETRTAASIQSHVATAIAGCGKALSVNTKHDGPFAKELKRNYPGEAWRGGKVDDICVIAVIAVEEGR